MRRLVLLLLACAAAALPTSSQRWTTSTTPTTQGRQGRTLACHPRLHARHRHCRRTARLRRQRKLQLHQRSQRKLPHRQQRHRLRQGSHRKSRQWQQRHQLRQRSRAKTKYIRFMNELMTNPSPKMRSVQRTMRSAQRVNLEALNLAM